MARKKIENTTRIDGKADRPTPQTLDQVWGFTGLSKYDTMDIVEYTARISGFSRADLFNEAARVGLNPIDNLEMLRKRLTAEFKNHVNTYKTVPDQITKPANISKEVQRILDEGK